MVRYMTVLGLGFNSIKIKLNKYYKILIIEHKLWRKKTKTREQNSQIRIKIVI